MTKEIAITPADLERAAVIRRYKAAYEQAHGHQSPGVSYNGRRYRVGHSTVLTREQILRAIERMEAVATR